jgi:hypothetical protein
VCVWVGSRLVWNSAASVFVICKFEQAWSHCCDCWSAQGALRNGPAQRQPHHCDLSLHLGFRQARELECGPFHQALESPLWMSSCWQWRMGLFHVLTIDFSLLHESPVRSLSLSMLPLWGSTEATGPVGGNGLVMNPLVIGYGWLSWRPDKCLGCLDVL